MLSRRQAHRPHHSALGALTGRGGAHISVLCGRGPLLGVLGVHAPHQDLVPKGPPSDLVDPLLDFGLGELMHALLVGLALFIEYLHDDDAPHAGAGG